MTALTDRLATSEPSRENDWLTHRGVRVRPLSIYSDAEWKQLCRDYLPHYTSSLDAKVPEENIIRVEYEPLFGMWCAYHLATKPRRKVFIGYHPTSEAIARRIAGLLARKEA